MEEVRRTAGPASPGVPAATRAAGTASGVEAVTGAAEHAGGPRLERDALGERAVPAERYYGVQTARAVENFPISGVPLSRYPVLVRSLAMVKLAAAQANLNLRLVPGPMGDAIMRACEEIIRGLHHREFVVDMVQGGAGTSTNMNANEVIANRALELLGHDRGDYGHCHPNNHVNCSQSTNDVYPTALKIALIQCNEHITGVLADLVRAFERKAQEFGPVVKMGRTQLQDAVPTTLGNTFGACAVTLGEEIHRLHETARLFLEINLGGTAIGTGINAHSGYAAAATANLARLTGLELQQAPNLVEATQDAGAFVMYSSALKRLAVKLSRICNDLRLLSSGPRAGFNEINLPPVQPGSSIMPGKVNPVIPEVVNQVCFKVIGNDLTVTLAAEAGQLELNAMEPIIAQCLLESGELLRNGMQALRTRCMGGITANPAICGRDVERSIGMVTALVPHLGYETCSRLAHRALAEDRAVSDLVLEEGLMSRDRLEECLSVGTVVYTKSISRYDSEMPGGGAT